MSERPAVGVTRMAKAPASAGVYTGSISGNGDNRQGSVTGFFYGPGAAETGGNFAVQATRGPNYIASGIFAGKLTGPIH